LLIHSFYVALLCDVLDVFGEAKISLKYAPGPGNKALVLSPKLALQINSMSRLQNTSKSHLDVEFFCKKQKRF